MPAPAWELRHGRWQDVLADVTSCDAVITDPPYTSRVVFGYRSGSDWKKGVPKTDRKFTIPYEAITEDEAKVLAEWMAGMGPRFTVAFNDHIGWRWIAEPLEAAGRYVFSPVVWLRHGGPPRFLGDGPADSCEYICVSRPRGKQKVGSLPGFYLGKVLCGLAYESEGVVGQKPLWLMRAIIRDYTRPGDLVVDPYAGSGTTLLAAVMEGRRAIGAEMDAGRYALARRRLEAGHTPDMFAGAE